MIVCVCRGISHHKLLEIIQEGASSLEAITARCGAGGDCGSCQATLQSLIHRSQRAAESSTDGGCRAAQPPIDAAA
jgi:bacterioferritin-associated ferredoxin